MGNLPLHLLLPDPKDVWLVCTHPGKPPVEYVGDWPVRGAAYACDIRPCFRTGEPHVYIRGFMANKPYGAFKRHRFRLVAEAWLN